MMDLMPAIIPGCSAPEDRALARCLWDRLHWVLLLHLEAYGLHKDATEAFTAVTKAYLNRHPDKYTQIYHISAAFCRVELNGMWP